jgi:hypothetical protein
MSAAVAIVDVPTEEKRVRGMIERATRKEPRVHWRYSAHSNERFPLRLYASARREENGKGHDIVVIAVEIFNPADDQSDRLVVSADIMDDDGVILEQGPRYEVPVPAEAQLLSDPHAEVAAVAKQVNAAMKKLDRWLTSQAPVIQAALAQS